MLGSSKDSENPEPALEDNAWGVDNDGDDWGDEEDWGGNEASNSSDNKTISVDDLEAMIANCEMHASRVTEVLPAAKKLQSISPALAKDSISQNKNIESCANDLPPSFQHHDLEMVNEPPTGAGIDDSDDEDGEIGCDSSKVDQMLSRYLDMEEDKEILSALNSCNKGGDISINNNGGGDGGERYERLPPEERAFLAFSKRLKRTPMQVARYAYGGVPLWSVPLPPKDRSKLQSQNKQRQKQRKSQKKPVRVFSPLPTVPNCCCGAERVFEFQILPSLLHVLDVDSYTAAKQRDEDDMMDLISAGGMNWGSIAVYSCSESCNKSQEEFIMVQESVCDSPIKKSLVSNNDNSAVDDDIMDS
eukprot:CAMPEP_0181134386 /NCGR_PEP_ID=MMETSP1071-20121207/32061_1 /TAXON_ID=35127 /ORGANISM="Thalassiosira sp., Strain NH16" /LENGTH=359 /DNA_ID=CAMNT_0023220903 /DNA_START=403 /DNA_END=1485 /DNA_ORIENTATION=-